MRLPPGEDLKEWLAVNTVSSALGKLQNAGAAVTCGGAKGAAALPPREDLKEWLAVNTDSLWSNTRDTTRPSARLARQGLCQPGRSLRAQPLVSLPQVDFYNAISILYSTPQRQARIKGPSSLLTITG